jgi:hypothetical protein
MLQTAQLLPQKGFRRWASARPVSRPSRQPATGPPGSYPDGTHTRWRRRACVRSGQPINHLQLWAHEEEHVEPVQPQRLDPQALLPPLCSPRFGCEQPVVVRSASPLSNKSGRVSQTRPPATTSPGSRGERLARHGRLVTGRSSVRRAGTATPDSHHEARHGRSCDAGGGRSRASGDTVKAYLGVFTDLRADDHTSQRLTAPQMLLASYCPFSGTVRPGAAA